MFQLISLGGSGSNDTADSFVEEACEYYSVNQDFTLEHLKALTKLFPHLQTIKELTTLCPEDVSLTFRHSGF